MLKTSDNEKTVARPLEGLSLIAASMTFRTADPINDAYLDFLRGNMYSVEKPDGSGYFFDPYTSSMVLAEEVLDKKQFFDIGNFELFISTDAPAYQKNDLCGTDLLAVTTNRGVNLWNISPLHKYTDTFRNDVVIIHPGSMFSYGDIERVFSDEHPAFIGIKKEALSTSCSDLDLRIFSPNAAENEVKGDFGNFLRINYKQDLNDEFLFSYDGDVVSKYSLAEIPDLSNIGYMSEFDYYFFLLESEFSDRIMALDEMQSEEKDLVLSQSVAESGQGGFFSDNIAVAGVSSCVGLALGVAGNVIWNKMYDTNNYGSQIDEA